VSKTIHKTFLLLQIILLFTLAAHSQEVNSPGLFHYPARLVPGDLRWAITVEFAKIPEDIIEEASFVRAPLFKFSARYGLPENFVVNGQITTQIINNAFQLGAGWVYKRDRLHVQVDYGLAYWFGALKVVDGFDNSANGWINYPGISVGYDFGALALTARGELNLVTSLSTFAGDVEVSTDNNFFNGYSASLVMEQPLYREKYITLGVRMNRIKFYWPTWPLFPTFDRFYYIPEFIVGFRLLNNGRCCSCADSPDFRAQTNWMFSSRSSTMTGSSMRPPPCRRRQRQGWMESTA
jgi:hypothetical protein